MKKLYFINLWDEALTKRGLFYLEKKGYSVAGNWLTSKYYKSLKDFNPDFIIYAPTSDKETINQIMSFKKPFLIWVLYPDQNVGWDYNKKIYLKRKQAYMVKLINHSVKKSSIVVNSNFTSGLIKDTYKIGDDNIKAIYPGIDTKGIYKYKRRKKSKPLSVLWNHKWRTDKGFLDALKIVYKLSKKYPFVKFTMGSKERWGECPNLRLMKSEYKKFRSNLKGIENISFIKTFRLQEDYWDFLSKYDLSFSVSHHESFGLGMLESSLLHATVVPNNEVYPELYKKFISEDVEKDLDLLIRNKSEINELRYQRKRISLKFDIIKTLKKLLKEIEI